MSIRTSCVRSLVAVVVLAAPATAFAAPILVNGSFEAVNVGGQATVSAASAPGWTQPDASGFPFIIRQSSNGCQGGSYEMAADGCQYAIIGGGEITGDDGYLQQTISGFTIGNSYLLSWMQASEYDWQRGLFNPATVDVAILGAATQTAEFTSPGNNLVQYWGNWVPMNYTFLADATTLSIRFSSEDVNYLGQFQLDPGIDNVRLTEVNASAVPEPASLVLLGSGLVLAARRRKTKS